MSAVHHYTPAEIDYSLTALALCGGNVKRAAATIKQNPGDLLRTPSVSQLSKWRHKYAERYAELVEHVAPRIEKATIHHWREIMVRATETIAEGIDHARSGMSELDAKDAAAATRNISITAGVAVDKLMLMTDRPTQRIDRPDPERDLEALAKRLGLVHDSTAEEIPADRKELTA